MSIELKNKIRIRRIRSKLDIFNKHIRLLKFSLKKYDDELYKKYTDDEILQHIDNVEEAIKCEFIVKDLSWGVRSKEYEYFANTINFEVDETNDINTIILNTYKSLILANIFTTMKNITYDDIKNYTIDELEEYFDNRNTSNNLDIEQKNEANQTKPWWKFWY
jgi:hypothetical protein